MSNRGALTQGVGLAATIESEPEAQAHGVLDSRPNYRSILF
jgi:hypothetical protein